MEQFISIVDSSCMCKMKKITPSAQLCFNWIIKLSYVFQYCCFIFEMYVSNNYKNNRLYITL